jgi:hypothetical protein
MNRDIKETIDQLAQSLQVVTLLSTQLRHELTESAQRAVNLEAAADEAVRQFFKNDGEALNPRIFSPPISIRPEEVTSLNGIPARFA